MNTHTHSLTLSTALCSSVVFALQEDELLYLIPLLDSVISNYKLDFLSKTI